VGCLCVFFIYINHHEIKVFQIANKRWPKQHSQIRIICREKKDSTDYNIGLVWNVYVEFERLNSLQIKLCFSNIYEFNILKGNFKCIAHLRECGGGIKTISILSPNSFFSPWQRFFSLFSLYPVTKIPCMTWPKQQLAELGCLVTLTGSTSGGMKGIQHESGDYNGWPWSAG
jgi:hypothetical protein